MSAPQPPPADVGDAARRADAVATFRAVTAVGSDQEATQILQTSGWDLERAVDSFLSTGSPSGSAPAPAAPGRNAQQPSQVGPVRGPSGHANGHSRAPADARPAPRWLVALFAPLRFVWQTVCRFADLIVTLLGGSARAIEAAPGNTPARRFRAYFESRHGTAHPDFFDGSYLAALAHAQSQVRFLIVYLHSEEHSLTREFCAQVLADAEVIRIADETSFTFWAGSITQVDGSILQDALRVPGFPFIGIVAPPRSTVRVPASSTSGASRVSTRPPLTAQNYGSLLSCRAGPGAIAGPLERTAARNAHGIESGINSASNRSVLASEANWPAVAASAADERPRGDVAAAAVQSTAAAGTVSWIGAVLRENSGLLDSVRLEREERDNARLLRMEQDKEFARSLEADRARERAREEAEQRARDEAVRIEEREMRRERKQASMPAEPEKGPGIASIVLRLPGGERANRRFDKDSLLEQVFDWAEVNSVDIELACLVSSYPRKTFRYPEHGHITLQEAGFFPSAMLLIEERSEDDG